MSFMLQRAFEIQGQVREKLTALQAITADLDDGNLSRSLHDAMRANTAGITRTNELLQLTKPTDPPGDDHHSQNAGRVS